MKTHDRLLQALALTISLAFLCAWVGAVGSSSAADAARPAPVVKEGAAPMQAERAPFPEVEAQSDPIREVYSDGGYWYWLERNPAESAK